MKKLILSAFALSLVLLTTVSFAQTEGVDDFLGLESELMPELKGEQKFTKTDFHEAEELKVLPEKVEKDVVEPLKGQGYSIVPWNNLDPEEWLNISTWIKERKIKDETPDWKIRLRLDAHKELVGKILQCQGKCFVYRGTDRAHVQHLSRLVEGDELHTEEGSIAWVYLMDGSLVRLSPKSSLTLQEINITKTDFFFLLRLNEGHAFWSARTRSELPVEFGPETDSISLPLMVREANQEWFERELFQKQNSSDRPNEVLELEESAVKNQFAKINELKSKNNSSMNLGTKVMMVSPNSTLVAQNASFDFIYFPGGKAHFRKRTSVLGEEFTLHLRGYSNTQGHVIGETVWHEVENTGRSYVMMDNVPGTLQVLELITKRVKSMELAREFWLETYTIPLVSETKEAEKLATNFGFHLWGDEHNDRFQFLIEYTRRVETTHLRSLENLIAKLTEKGEIITREITEELYQASLNNYLFGLKSRYDNKRMQVREMNDLQYYVWILKNGKL